MKPTPMTSDTRVPAAQITSVLTIADWTLSLPSTDAKLPTDRSKRPNPSTMGLVVVSAPSSSIVTG